MTFERHTAQTKAVNRLRRAYSILDKSYLADDTLIVVAERNRDGRDMYIEIAPDGKRLGTRPVYSYR